ncbi:MAG: hypothetical protein ACE5F1_10865 [Planctomycetota bacterium]
MNPCSKPSSRLPCLLVVLLQACSGIGITADAGVARWVADGDVSLGPSSGAPVNLDNLLNNIGDVFGLDEGTETPYARVELSAPVASFTFSGFTYDTNADGVLANNFGDLLRGANVSTDAEIANLKGAVHFDLLNLGMVRISPGLGVDLLDLSIAANSSLGTEQVDALAPMPMLFVQGEVEIGPFDGVLDLGYFEANLPEADGQFFDIEAILRWRPLERMELFAGYRMILADAKGDTVGQLFAADLQLSGWMAGIGFRL